MYVVIRNPSREYHHNNLVEESEIMDISQSKETGNI